VALSASVHVAGAAGAVQRSVPTGGAAYGIPRKALTPDVGLYPVTGPEFVSTVTDAAREAKIARDTTITVITEIDLI